MGGGGGGGGCSKLFLTSLLQAFLMIFTEVETLIETDAYYR